MNTRLMVLVALAVPAILVGCSTDSNMVLTPTTGTAAHETCRVLTGGFDSDWIGTEGGTITVDSVALVIPEGALTTTTLITVTTNPDGSVELGPHGQVFNVPVNLTFVTPMVSGGTVFTVEWFNPTTENWQTITSRQTTTGQTAPLEHFSLYRISLTK